MAKTLEDYVYNPSLVRYARAMNLSLGSFAAELSAAMGSDLKESMDNAQNAMEEFKDVPTPTLPPIRKPKRTGANWPNRWESVRRYAGRNRGG